MTKEEMIEQLENTILLIKQNGKDWLDERDVPILEACIQRMKTEPCEDCISRSVQLKVKTGHWIMPVRDDGMSEPICYQVRCSQCGFDLDPQTWHTELHQYGADKYCPNCGAKMEVE